MSIDIPLLKLQDAWRECERHIYHVGHALSAIRTFSPLTAESIDLLTDEQVQDIDRFYEKKKCVLFATALHTTTRMTQKKMQRN